MKKILLTIISLLLIKSAHGEETAYLRMKISGTTTNKPYFICISNAGCFNIKAGNQGARFAINPGKLTYIMPLMVSNYNLNMQELPKSCETEVKSNQTIIISGKLVTNQNHEIYLNHLTCKVK